MRLWTCQNRALDITDQGSCVDSARHSVHLNSLLIDCQERRNAYERLWRVLGTSQILWCFTDEGDAKRYPEHVRGDYDLWELNIDQARRHWRVCPMTWHWILDQVTTLPPSRFDWMLPFLEERISDYSRETFWEDFNLPWKQQTLDRRWEMLFYEKKDIVPGCTHVILPHPVDPSCVVARTAVRRLQTSAHQI